MEFRILGALGASDGQGPVTLGGHRQQLVMAVLLEHANETVSTDRLVDEVWGRDPPSTARKTLQVYISRLRRALGDRAIETRGDGYVLLADAEDVDAIRFERLADRGRALLSTDPPRAAMVLREALSLWQGSPWGPLGDEPALRADAERLRERRLEAVEDRIAADLASGSVAGLAGELDALVGEHPLRERLHGLRMLVLYRMGCQADALASYRELQGRLREELGVEPSPELRRLHEQVLRQDPELAGPVPGPPQEARATTEVRNPYKGLRAFGEDDADDFHGRDTFVRELLGRLTTERFLAVIGASGSGKSSVVRAGVLPAVRDGDLGDAWLVTTMRPGAHPFEEVEAGLLRAREGAPTSLGDLLRGDDLDLLRAVLRVLPDETTRLLLVVDQLEELFLLTDDDVRARFVRNLVEAVEDPHGRLSVLATLRADFFDRPLEHPGLAELVVAGQVTLTPLSPAQLEAACVWPAASVGVTVEPELAAELVADVADQPGALPLFEYALTELFDARAGDTLTLGGYRRLGGLRGALARRADAAYDQLDVAARHAARQVLLRLVTLGEGVEDTRRRVGRGELDALDLDAAVVTTVLERFGQARLLSFDRDPGTGEATVDVAHEALLREWPRLRRWIDEARDDLRRHRQLATEAQEWEAADRHADYLVAGSRLDLLDAWSRTTTLELTRSERAYLDASRQRQARDAAAEAERQEHELALERRAGRRLRSLVAVLAVAALVGAGLTAFATGQAGQAREARDQALVAAQELRARELTAAAVANRNVDPELSLLLALHAVTITEAIGEPIPADTIAALHLGLQAAHVPYPVRDAPTTVLEGPDGPQGAFLLDLPQLLALARDQVDRHLTPAECDRWFDPGACPHLPPAFPADVIGAGLDTRTGMTTGGMLPGTRVRIMAGGLDETDFEPVLASFRQDTGITITIDQENAFEDLLESRVARGQVDIALIPQPALVAELARLDALVELASYIDRADLRNTYPPHLVALGSVADDGTWPSPQGHVYGLPQRVEVKSLVWFPAPEFERAGYEVPTTLDELDALTEQLVADGRTPWCHAEGSPGEVAGWPGTDWIEDLVLHADGREVYDAWVTHEIPFEDPRIRGAFERFANLVLRSGHVASGAATAATLPLQVAQHPMFDDPPGCWLAHTASFAPSSFPYGVDPFTDVGTFAFPGTARVGTDAVMGSGEYLVAFTDRPEVRETVRFLLGTDFAEDVIRDVTPGWYTANRHVSLDVYPGRGPREIMERLRAALAADTFRFDGSDLMPPAVFVPWWDAMVRYVGEGPGNLDDLLAELDAAWEAVSASDGDG